MYDVEEAKEGDFSSMSSNANSFIEEMPHSGNTSTHQKKKDKNDTGWPEEKKYIVGIRECWMESRLARLR